MHLEKPHIRIIKADETVKVGTPLKLRVKVSGTPEISVTWLHQGAPLAGDVFVRRGHGTSRLTVRKAFLRHSGTYTVIAESKEGRDQLDFPVKVVGKSKKV